MTERKVACWGCFDGELHEGHHFFLGECLKHGNQLYVFVVKDEVIITNKKREPIFSQAERVKKVQAVDGVTLVVALLGNIEHQYKQVLEIKPSTYCFGEDQLSPFDFELEKKLLRQGAQIIRVKRIGSISTSQLYFQKPTE